MPDYRVRVFERGIWNGHEPKTIKAYNEAAAAQSQHGSRLTESGKVVNLRYVVWEHPFLNAKKMFYEPE